MTHGRIEALGQRLCLGGAALGAVGLVAWLFGAMPATSIVGKLPPTMPNTSLGLLLLGVAAALRLRDESRARRWISFLLAALVLVAGLVTTAEYVFAVDLHIDQLLVKTTVGPYPGRMSPPTAIAFALLGTAILALDARPRGLLCPAEWLAISTGLIALTAALGPVFGAGPLYRPEADPVIAVAPGTALSVLAISVGVLLERPNRGVLRLATSSGPGGLLLRRLSLAAVVAPMLLGILLSEVLGVLGLEDLPIVYATLSVAATVVGLALLTVVAVPLDRMHDDLEANREALARDVEERKRADEAARLARGKLAGIVALSSDAIVSMDEQMRVALFNESAERLFGRPASEVIGARFDLLIPERFQGIVASSFADFAAHDGANDARAWPTLSVGRREDGTEFPVEAAISRLHIDGTRCFTVTLRDVTEQKLREREKELLADVGTVLASTLDLESTLRIVGDLAVRDLADTCLLDIVAEHGEVERIHVVARDASKASACNALMQIRLDRTRPHLPFEALQTKHTVFVERLSSEMIAAMAQSEEHLAALQALEPSSLLAVPLLARDELLGVIILLTSTPRTFTDRDVHLAEELARRTALWLENVRLYRTARRAINARDEVIGVVAHDLRNPLQLILIQAAVLNRESELHGSAQRPADVIDRSARRMNRLIQDLLDATRLESGRVVLTHDRVTPSDVVSDSVDAQRPLASIAAVEIASDAPPDLPELWADRDRLLQIFENLIGNALKFTPRGGRITVGAAPRAGEVLFWVSDTGVGIDPIDIPHVFDRFWRPQRHDGRRGAGLGLTIVKGMVEAHGGRVWVTSRPGEGSTFFFTIPVAHPEEIPLQGART